MELARDIISKVKNKKKIHQDGNVNIEEKPLLSSNIIGKYTDELISNQEENVNLQENPSLFPQFAAALTAALVQMGLGAAVGLVAVTIPRLTDKNSNDFILNINEVALYASLVLLGAMAGCVISSVLQVRLGQRQTMLVFLPAELASWLHITFTCSVEMLLLGRFLLGFFVGSMAAAAYTYAVEISHKTYRGGLVSTVDLVRVLGVLLAYCLGSLSLTWREISLICGCVCTILPFIVLLFLPDSPRYLAFRKEVERARKSLKYFRGKNFNVEPELNNILEQLKKDESKGTIEDQVYQLVKLENLKIFLLLVFINFLVAFNGNFVVLSYAVEIFQAANTNINPYLCTIIIGVIRVLGSAVNLCVVDRLGRKVILVLSFLVLSFSGAVLGVYFYLHHKESNISNLGWLPLTCLVIFSFFSTIGQPIVSILRAELLPTSIRSLGFNLISAILYFSAFSVSQTYPHLVLSIGVHGAFWLYTLCNIAVVATVGLFIPETKGKSLEEIVM